MRDPWTGKRDLIKHAAMSDNSWPRMLGKEMEGLLDDADALLVKSRATDEFWAWLKDLDLDIWGTNQPEVTDKVNSFEKALAALPEHLRAGANDEATGEGHQQPCVGHNATRGSACSCKS